MTEHDFVPGPYIADPGEKAKTQRSFICSLCRRTTTTPSSPAEACPGPSGIGPDRLGFLQLLELRRSSSALERVADLMQARAADLYAEVKAKEAV